MRSKAFPMVFLLCVLGLLRASIACDDAAPDGTPIPWQSPASDTPARSRELPRARIAAARQDMDGDGAPDEIRLLADVELAADGTPLWEDGHRWAIVVRDGVNEHTVVDEFVPQGRLEAWVVQPPEGTPILVVLRESGTAGIGLRAFRHLDGEYAEVEVLDGRLVARLEESPGPD